MTFDELDSILLRSKEASTKAGAEKLRNLAEDQWDKLVNRPEKKDGCCSGKLCNWFFEVQFVMLVFLLLCLIGFTFFGIHPNRFYSWFLMSVGGILLLGNIVHLVAAICDLKSCDKELKEIDENYSVMRYAQKHNSVIFLASFLKEVHRVLVANGGSLSQKDIDVIKDCYKIYLEG